MRFCNTVAAAFGIDRCLRGVMKRSNDNARLIVTTIMGLVFGFLIGVSFPSASNSKTNYQSSFIAPLDLDSSRDTRGKSLEDIGSQKIYVPTNAHGAELLAPGIVVAETDLYLRRLWGDPGEDLPTKAKYLVTFTVGFEQKDNIDAAIKKFSDDFQFLLFHYDGRASEWNESVWSKRAIHISAPKQTKWWYAKRFLHPDVIAAYDYIFLWDEDLGVEHFNGDKYMELVKKHGLEISQPGVKSHMHLTWGMTKRRDDVEVHKKNVRILGWWSDPQLPPNAAFVEIMAPVFSRDAWRCVWYMIQNDLVHGWGLDFALRRCVEPAHEKIGVVDAEWVLHKAIPSLGNQNGGNAAVSESGSPPYCHGPPFAKGPVEKGVARGKAVKKRCREEWAEFQRRLGNAEQEYLANTYREGLDT